MPAKQLHFGTTARSEIQRGIDKLANAVKITLGPRGRNVVLDKAFGSPLSTKDGVTVAKEIELANPFENIGAQMVNLLKGDILATTSTSLAVLVGVFGAVTAVLFAFRKEFLLVSFDRDLAIVFGKRVGLWDGLLYLLIGVTISLGVMTAGPLVTFGFLVVPPLTARLVTRRMLSFSLVAAVLGGASAFGGFYLAYRIDLPLGPAEVALASLLLALVGAGTALRRAVGRLAS